MRFRITIGINKNEIPKDKNRIIISLIKHQLSQFDTELFSTLYVTAGFCFLLTAPGFCLSSARCMSSVSICMPAGQPSMTAPTALPWLSPNVVTRKIVLNVLPVIIQV